MNIFKIVSYLYIYIHIYLIHLFSCSDLLYIYIYISIFYFYICVYAPMIRDRFDNGGMTIHQYYIILLTFPHMGMDQSWYQGDGNVLIILSIKPSQSGWIMQCARLCMYMYIVCSMALGTYLDTYSHIWIYLHFRRNKDEQSLCFLKVSQNIHPGQLQITCSSPFCVAGGGRSIISPPLEHGHATGVRQTPCDRVLREEGVQKKKPNMFTVGRSTRSNTQIYRYIFPYCIYILNILSLMIYIYIHIYYYMHI